MTDTARPQRNDEISPYYAPIETCEKWATRIFLVCAFLSLVVPYSENLLQPWIGNGIRVLFVISVVIYSFVSGLALFFFIPRAERMRRKQLISDALDVPLVPESTANYYNNSLSPSLDRLGASVLENAFFSMRVCGEMAKEERSRTGIYLLIWITAMLWRTTDLGVLLAVTQAVFSAEIVFRWVKVEFLRVQNEKIYDELYAHFMKQHSAHEPADIATILDAFASYEAAKTAAGIKQSSRIFHQKNDELSKEWKRIRRTLQIGESA